MTEFFKRKQTDMIKLSSRRSGFLPTCLTRGWQHRVETCKPVSILPTCTHIKQCRLNHNAHCGKIPEFDLKASFEDTTNRLTIYFIGYPIH